MVLQLQLTKQATVIVRVMIICTEEPSQATIDVLDRVDDGEDDKD